jgi:hypothetical protein
VFVLEGGDIEMGSDDILDRFEWLAIGDKYVDEFLHTMKISLKYDD